MIAQDHTAAALEIIGPCYCDEISDGLKEIIGDGLGKGACITCLFTDALAAAFRAGAEHGVEAAATYLSETLARNHPGALADAYQHAAHNVRAFALPVEEPRG